MRKGNLAMKGVVLLAMAVLLTGCGGVPLVPCI
jgi:hypothetical protein